eukprot:TRINITY_DN77374_c0_g1_i1.p1 TRINITY_DN77374_c0_g1~~TRINITY_DN77374_c0_g1_i1.p1  ORF type:complete len:141 (+),score=12.81 TRINITY_DN77374_c0_g1_i1:189-611(+)
MLHVPIQHAPREAVAFRAFKAPDPAGSFRWKDDEYFQRFGTLNKAGWFENEMMKTKSCHQRPENPLRSISTLSRSASMGSLHRCGHPQHNSPQSEKSRALVGGRSRSLSKGSLSMLDTPERDQSMLSHRSDSSITRGIRQ